MENSVKKIGSGGVRGRILILHHIAFFFFFFCRDLVGIQLYKQSTVFNKQQTKQLHQDGL